MSGDLYSDNDFARNSIPRLYDPRRCTAFPSAALGMLNVLHRPGVSVTLVIIATVVILYAGLSPFDFNPPNSARFDVDVKALCFDGHGFAHSERPFEWRDEDTEVAVEIWLLTADTTSNDERMILVLDDGEKAWPLELIQEGSDLLIRDRVINEDGERWSHESRFPSALQAGVVQHIVVSSSDHGPLVFVEAQPIQKSSGFPIPTIEPGESFGGWLFLGATALPDSPWTGDILGLALYARSLSLGEIEQHGAVVAKSGIAALLQEPGLAALYSFAHGDPEGGFDLVEPGNPMTLPRYFLRFRRNVLRWPRLEYWFEAWFVFDVALNVVGFVPWGMAVAFALAARRRWGRRTVVLTCTLLGAALSLGIELAQHFELGRDSSLLDLVLNTCGAALGGFLGFRLRGTTKGQQERSRN